MAVKDGSSSAWMKDSFKDWRLSASSWRAEVLAMASTGRETEMEAGRAVVEKREVDTCVITSLLSPESPLL